MAKQAHGVVLVTDERQAQTIYNIKGDKKMKKEIIASAQAPAAVGPYSQAIKIGDLVYTSGQIGLDPASGKLVGDEVQAQANQVLTNLAHVLEAAGTSLAHVVKTTVFLQDMADYAAVNEVYASYFGEVPPARSAVAVAALPLGAKVEIEAVAVLPSDTAVFDDEATHATEDELLEEDLGEASAVFITQAVTAVETAVASGLRQISSFLADIQKDLETRAAEKNDTSQTTQDN